MLANKTDAKSNWVTSLTKANSKTDSYSDGVQGGDINAILSSLNSAKTAADQVSIWQKWLNDINRGTGVYSKYAKNTSVLNNAWKNYSTGYANWLKDAKIPDSISGYIQNAPLDPLPDYMQGYLALDPSNADSIANYQTTLSKSLGNLSDSKGNPLIPAANIALAAKGSPSAFNSLVDRVDKAAYSAATKGTSGLSVTDPKERFNLIKGFMSNPQSIVPLQTPLKITGTGNDTVTGGTGNDTVTGGTKTDTVTGGTKTDTTAGGTGLDTLAKNINPKLLDENGNFRPYLSTWTAPKQGVVTNNSPYSGLLDAMLNKVTGANYGTPETNKTYDALTSALTQGVGVNSLPKPKVTYNANNPAGITGLGIDYTGRTLTPLNTQVTSAPSYTDAQVANKLKAEKDAAEAARLKALQDKALQDKALQDKALQDKALQDAEAARLKAIQDKANSALLSKYSINNYILPETRAALTRGSSSYNADFYKSVSSSAPNLEEQIKYSNLIDSLAGNTGSVTTGVSLGNAGKIANTYNTVDNTDYTYSPTASDYINKETRDAIKGNQTWLNSLTAKDPNFLTKMTWSETQDYAHPGLNTPTGIANTPAAVGLPVNADPNQRTLNVAPQPVVTTPTQTTPPAASAWWQDMGYSSPQEAMDIGGFDSSSFSGAPQQTASVPTQTTPPAQNANLGIINPATLGPIVSSQAMNSNAGGVASLVGPQQVQLTNPLPTPLVLAPPTQTTTTASVPTQTTPPAVVQTQPAASAWWQDMGYSSPQEAMDIGGFDSSSFR